MESIFNKVIGQGTKKHTPRAKRIATRNTITIPNFAQSIAKYRKTYKQEPYQSLPSLINKLQLCASR